MAYQPPPVKRRSVWPWILGAIAVVTVILCAGFLGTWAANADKAEDRPTFLSPAKSSGTKASGKASASAAPKAKPKQTPVKPGAWIAGDEIRTGTYRTPGAAGKEYQLCTWDIRNAAGSIVDAGMVTGVDEPGRATLSDGDEFKTSGCKPWVLQ